MLKVSSLVHLQQQTLCLNLRKLCYSYTTWRRLLPPGLCTMLHFCIHVRKKEVFADLQAVCSHIYACVFFKYIYIQLHRCCCKCTPSLNSAGDCACAFLFNAVLGLFFLVICWCCDCENKSNRLAVGFVRMCVESHDRSQLCVCVWREEGIWCPQSRCIVSEDNTCLYWAPHRLFLCSLTHHPLISHWSRHLLTLPLRLLLQIPCVSYRLTLLSMNEHRANGNL